MGKNFISYSHKDAGFVTFLASSLRRRNIEYWQDIEKQNIPPGFVWDKIVHEALKKAERLLLVMSPNAMSSDEVGAEWKYALECQIPIVPIYYQTCEIWYRLRPLEYIDFRKDYKDGIEQLANVLVKPLLTDRIPCDEPVGNDPTPYIKQLKHESWHVRLNAIDTLLKLGAGAGLLALVQALSDPHSCVSTQINQNLDLLQVNLKDFYQSLKQAENKLENPDSILPPGFVAVAIPIDLVMGNIEDGFDSGVFVDIYTFEVELPLTLETLKTVIITSNGLILHKGRVITVAIKVNDSGYLSSVVQRGISLFFKKHEKIPPAGSGEYITPSNIK